MIDEDELFEPDLAKALRVETAPGLARIDLGEICVAIEVPTTKRVEGV